MFFHVQEKRSPIVTVLICQKIERIAKPLRKIFRSEVFNALPDENLRADVVRQLLTEQFSFTIEEKSQSGSSSKSNSSHKDFSDESNDLAAPVADMLLPNKNSTKSISEEEITAIVKMTDYYSCKEIEWMMWHKLVRRVHDLYLQSWIKPYHSNDYAIAYFLPWQLLSEVLQFLIFDSTFIIFFALLIILVKLNRLWKIYVLCIVSISISVNNNLDMI